MKKQSEARDIQHETTIAVALIANFRDVIADDEDLLFSTIEGETELYEAIRRGVARITDVGAFCKALKEREAELKERRERYEGQSERIKLAIFHAMEQAGLLRLELAEATLSTKEVPAKAVISAEADIPPIFWKPQAPTLDKKAVLDALKAGEQVPGATLSNAARTLQIRNK